MKYELRVELRIVKVWSKMYKLPWVKHVYGDCFMLELRVLLVRILFIHVQCTYPCKFCLARAIFCNYNIFTGNDRYPICLLGVRREKRYFKIKRTFENQYLQNIRYK